MLSVVVGRLQHNLDSLPIYISDVLCSYILSGYILATSEVLQYFDQSIVLSELISPRVVHVEAPIRRRFRSAIIQIFCFLFRSSQTTNKDNRNPSLFTQGTTVDTTTMYSTLWRTVFTTKDHHLFAQSVYIKVMAHSRFYYIYIYIYTHTHIHTYTLFHHIYS